MSWRHVYPDPQASPYRRGSFPMQNDNDYRRPTDTGSSNTNEVPTGEQGSRHNERVYNPTINPDIGNEYLDANVPAGGYNVDDAGYAGAHSQAHENINSTKRPSSRYKSKITLNARGPPLRYTDQNPHESYLERHHGVRESNEPVYDETSYRRPSSQSTHNPSPDQYNAYQYQGHSGDTPGPSGQTSYENPQRRRDQTADQGTSQTPAQSAPSYSEAEIQAWIESDFQKYRRRVARAVKLALGLGEPPRLRHDLRWVCFNPLRTTWEEVPRIVEGSRDSRFRGQMGQLPRVLAAVLIVDLPLERHEPWHVDARAGLEEALRTTTTTKKKEKEKEKEKKNKEKEKKKKKKSGSARHEEEEEEARREMARAGGSGSVVPKMAFEYTLGGRHARDWVDAPCVFVPASGDADEPGAYAALEVGKGPAAAAGLRGWSASVLGDGLGYERMCSSAWEQQYGDQDSGELE